jgi:uncharacterized protein YfaS (alpha-2-macroglobulin family)
VTTAGVPAQDGPPQHEGLRIRRNFLTRDGQPVNLDSVHQNDVFVILLEGDDDTKLDHQLLVTNLLPAGWEIENPALGGKGTDDMPWLGDLSATDAVEARDDRFVASLDVTADAPKWRLAYLVRAVTPGTYELPGASVEDMVKPHFHARQATGHITILPP